MSASADSSRSGEGRSSWRLTEHEYDLFLIFLFRDAEDLPTGSQFGSQLLDAIAQSKISIPILSENYANSKWCLRELFQMLENRKSTGHVVMPIFDGVEHSHARHLTVSFGEAFHSHKMCFEQRDVEAGQQALRDVSFLQGWESEKIANGHPGEFVRIVVETVLSELPQGFWVDVRETLLGIDDHVRKITGLLDITSNSFRTIGIYGIGGIGKTTFTFG